jgi:preprotein translocase subunit SecD
MKRSLTLSLVGIMVLAFGLLALTFITNSHPVLGLDLRGGVSVVLKPTKSNVPSSSISKAVDIIRSRVDALGVAEPDISRQGQNVVISLPGVKDPDRALSLVGQTAELRFRPVLEQVPSGNSSSTSTTVAGQPAQTTDSNALTARADDDPAKEVVLAEFDPKDRTRETARYRLGPAPVVGSAVKTAQAEFDQNTSEWSVRVDFTGDGGDKFKALATQQVNKQVAIVLDGVVQSAPVIQPSLLTNFNNTAQITGNFTERQAKDLASVLRFGALPVQLERQAVQTVSATLGKDSLKAGVIAGIVGLALVLLYMIAYYRALGIVVVVGLCASGALLWSIICYLGASRGLALTLAGATGIIVSVGVTVDSYVVYFERLKDEIRSGKTVRSSVDRGFKRAYRTIVAADLVSFIAAAVLYLLTVGPVRGFAFYLGLSTLLDLVTAYFFTRPAVVLLGRSRFFTEARFFGVARGLAVAGPEPA